MRALGVDALLLKEKPKPVLVNLQETVGLNCGIPVVMHTNFRQLGSVHQLSLHLRKYALSRSVCAFILSHLVLTPGVVRVHQQPNHRHQQQLLHVVPFANLIET